MSTQLAASSVDSGVLAQFRYALLGEEQLSMATVLAYCSDLKQFLVRFLSPRSLLEAQHDDVLAYLHQVLESDQKMHVRTQARVLSSLRRFYLWAMDEGLLKVNPSDKISAIRLAEYVPDFLSEQEVEALLDAPDLSSQVGLRNKAMLEVLYATGLRVSELVSLKRSCCDLGGGVLRVRGKGAKDRLVPLGEEAVFWLMRYLQKVRSAWLTTDPEIVFVSQKGGVLTRQAFWYVIKKYAKQVVPNKQISPHSLRHAFATHLLNHGADLRSVQLLLGHADISSTQVYTHIAVAWLQVLHQQHHPRG